MNEELKNQIRSIIRNTRVNILLGAGASKFKVNKPLPLMNDLLDNITSNEDYKKKKKEFDSEKYGSLVLDVLKKSFESSEKSNIEEGISQLEGLVPYYEISELKELAKKLNAFIKLIKGIILKSFNDCDDEESAKKLGDFYDCLLKMTREKTDKLKRINVFSTNYDMLNEMALESKGFYYYSGFSGICTRNFNLALYNYQYTENFGLIDRNMQEYIGQINLYKLHGSFSWKINNGKLTEIQDYKNNKDAVLIFPSSAKYYSTNLITYYSALFREFINEMNKINSCLIVIGSSLNDDHINKIILDALESQSFTLIVLSWCKDDHDDIEKGKQKSEFEAKFGKRHNVFFDVSSQYDIESISKDKELFFEDKIK